MLRKRIPASLIHILSAYIIAISLWVLINVFKNIRAVFKVLLQATPDDINVDRLNDEIKNIKGKVREFSRRYS